MRYLPLLCYTAERSTSIRYHFSRLFTSNFKVLLTFYNTSSCCIPYRSHSYYLLFESSTVPQVSTKYNKLFFFESWRDFILVFAIAVLNHEQNRPFYHWASQTWTIEIISTYITIWSIYWLSNHSVTSKVNILWTKSQTHEVNGRKF